MWLAKTGSGQAIVRTVETDGRKRFCSHRTLVAAGWVSQLRIPSSTLCENLSIWSHLQHTKGSICQDRLEMNMGKVEKNGGKKGRFLQEGAVHGVEGLCVADASILPAVIATNLHLTCVMIGEKLADSLLRRRDDTAAAAAARL